MNSQKWFGIAIVVVVLVAAAYFFGQNSNQTSSKNAPTANYANTLSTTSTPQTNQSANNTTTGTSNDGVPLATPADWSNAPISGNVGGHWKKISLGATPVTQDGITFSQTITDLGQSIPNLNNLWGTYGNGYTTTGKFVQVDLTMNNETQSSAVVEVVLYFLADQAGRGYQFTADRSSCGGDGFLSAPQLLEPGIPCTAHILYEVSQSSQSFNLDFDMKNDQYNNNTPYGS